MAHFFVGNSVFGRKFSFPHFSQPCFIEFHWNLADGFSISSYRSYSTFVSVDPFFARVMAPYLVWNSVFRTFLSHASLNFIETWQIPLVWVVIGKVWLSFRLTHFYAPTIKWPGHIVLLISVMHWHFLLKHWKYLKNKWILQYFVQYSSCTFQTSQLDRY